MVRQYIQLGGVMMWPLVACSTLLGAILIERIWTVGLRHRLLGLRVTGRRLTWHRKALPFFIDVPPSIGLLGTVIGVVQSFRLTGGRMTADAAAAGLGVACFTTILGLAVALVASIARYGLDWLAGSVPVETGARGES